ncbi:MAG: hypothetical protein JO002_08410 [Burkholderiaceae bacterium]|nr:hypothetical protein [Burkholderiaceae bacterium]
MSGPKSAIFNADPMGVLLAYAAIEAAKAVAQAHAAASALQRKNEVQRDAEDERQAQAGAAGMQALVEQSRAAHEEFEHLALLVEKIGLGDKIRATRPATPEPAEAQDADLLAAQVRALRSLTANLHSILLTEAARLSVEFAEQPFDSAAAVAKSVPQQVSQRLLARIAHLGPIPEIIAKLALELDHTLPGEHADLLATELRAQVQAHAEQQQKRQVQEATAKVLEHTLHELGYQVEEVREILFVEGGMLHFRRAGWGNYMVRLRVDAKADALNFNVVRAVARGDNERSVLDHLAEDRWCSEFPALLRALEAQGIRLNVTRHLAAGELPVQLVDAAKLPVFSDEEDAGAREQQTNSMSRKLP